jgi:hypothetical protein
VFGPPFVSAIVVCLCGGKVVVESVGAGVDVDVDGAWADWMGN